MNNAKKNIRRRYSQLTRQLMNQYYLAVLIFVVALISIYFAAWLICSNIVWQPGPLYNFLYAVQETIIIWGSIIFLLGLALITRHYLLRPLSYLDETVQAAASLSQPSEESIVLPEVLNDVQIELNLAREQALRNARNAREAEQRKNDLIVYLAHDLKTPLTSVLGYLTLLRDEAEISSELRARYTNVALDKAQRLEELINEFFDITRFNLTHLTLEKETVNLSIMLEQITFEFNPVLAEKELSWDCHLLPDVQLTCDPDQLERVFDNLLRNAVNYSYRGTSILVSLERRAEQAIIKISNRGKTIPPEKLERIFEQFFRLDASRASSSGGAGLGLAIAKEIIELHGGTITAASADESISFMVTLPI